MFTLPNMALGVREEICSICKANYGTLMDIDVAFRIFGIHVG